MIFPTKTTLHSLSIRFLLCMLSFSLGGQLHAQIYADVSVSHGENALGTFRIQLEHEKSPRTVANFIGLATGQRNWVSPITGAVQVGKPYYDGLIFHRLIHDFMIQGGDPLGTGTGGPGYVFQDEFDASLSHSGPYKVSMANSGVNSNGSQFFITLYARTNLDQVHSIFGEVINDASFPNSRALIDSFRSSSTFPTNASDLPDTPITITSIAVSGPDLASFELDAPEHRLPYVNGKTISIGHDSSTSTSNVIWAAQDTYDYPVYYSNDLQTWSKLGNILSLSDYPNLALNISPYATTPSSFFTMAEIDYRDAPRAPQNLLSAGNGLDLQLTGGHLLLTFNGSGGGSWEFVYDDGITPSETGVITSVSLTDNTTYPIIPETGAYFNSAVSYARYLSQRQLTAYLDGPAGPDLLEIVQPLLSFHSNTTGWFNGGVYTESTGTVIFKGEFSFSEAP